MKSICSIFTLRRYLFVFIIILGLSLPAIVFAQSSCQWTYYPVSGGKLQAEQLLYNDLDGTSLTNMSLGNPYKGKTATLSNSGFVDFNGDNKTDVFRTTFKDSTHLQWQYSSGGTGPWQNLAYAGNDLPVSQLQFGNFNGDSATDVFANQYDSGAVVYQWKYSSGGTGNFVNLNSTVSHPDLLALGDFNGDGKTDVFTAKLNAGTYDWSYVSGGFGVVIPLAHAATDPSLLRFGDFNGDGVTDVFAADQNPDGSIQWKYSQSGTASYVNLNVSTVPYSELKFGDFDGDGITDILTSIPQSDGSLQVVYWPGGFGSPVTLGNIPGPAPALRIGDFNGDGISDLMAYRCGMNGPLKFSPRQTISSSGYSTFYNNRVGDVNGDGVSDIILVSTCQNPNSGVCASHHLQVGAALGTPSHAFTLVAPQQLGANNIDFTYFKAFSGDFNGDGKTDLAILYPGASLLTIYIALSNGDGTFTLVNSGIPQTFAGAWSTYNPSVGDFNGDGKTDLVFTTVCNISSGSCSVGDNNSLYLASSTGNGTFNMSARQDIGTTGWTDYYAYNGDFNGDGKTDIVFNSTCQKVNFVDSTCTLSDNNFVFTALSNGAGGFVLSSRQDYGSGWADFPNSIDLVGDMNGDSRSDLVWSSSYQTVGKTSNNQVVAGLSKPDGTFQLGSRQDYGSGWTGRLSLLNVNQDGKDDLIWNSAPYGDGDVDTYAAATSNGDGTFSVLGQGSVYTGFGYFGLPQSDDFRKSLSNLIISSTRQNPISNALFALESYLPTPVPTFTPTAIPTVPPTPAPTVNPVFAQANDLLTQLRLAVAIAKKKLPSAPGLSDPKKKKDAINAQRKAILAARKFLKAGTSQLIALQNSSGVVVQTAIPTFTIQNLKTLQFEIKTAIASNEKNPGVAKKVWKQVSALLMKLTV